MIYPEYEEAKARYIEAQRIFSEALWEKERLFTMTQPNAIRYDKDKVQISPSGSILDKYVEALEEQGIDEKLSTFRQLLEDRERLLKIKECDLRMSYDRIDKVYVCRFIDGHSIAQISKRLNYSRGQVYRIIQNIKRKMKLATKCDK